MEKIRLGKTEMNVSRLGFGSIPIQRLPEEEAVGVIKRCLELGINYIDTANGYSTSEERIGKAIAGRREEVFLATKSHSRTREGIEKDINLSLKRMGTDYIDLYQLHQVGDFKTLDEVLEKDGAVAVLEEAKKAGTIRHIGVTSHQIDVAKAAIESDRFETIMFPFNFIVCEAAEELLPVARKHDVGYIAMKPLAGGMLDNADICFKYLFQFPDVLPIPGIQEKAEIEEIVRILESSKEMTETDRVEMQRIRAELGTRFCRRCEYCQPCQQGIPISWVMVFPTFIKRQPVEWLYTGMIPELMVKALDCIDCGECETRCPYSLPIREIMSENIALYKKLRSQIGK